MKSTSLLMRKLAWSGVVALVLASVLVVAAPVAAAPNYETHAYYSVVKDEPSAPFTAADEFKRTSLIAYYSVVRDEPSAPFTDSELMKRTSLVPYYSVVH